MWHVSSNEFRIIELDNHLCYTLIGFCFYLKYYYKIIFIYMLCYYHVILFGLCKIKKYKLKLIKDE